MNKIVINNVKTQKTFSLDLSDEENESIREALKILERDLEMEILHDQIVEAFCDYRNKVDYWRLRSIAGFYEHIARYEVKSTLNRLAFNVFNLSKLFLDKNYHSQKDKCHVFEQTSSLEDKSNVAAKHNNLRNENIRYFIGCKLRNKSQHSCLPVSEFSSGFKLRLLDQKQFITFKITLNYDDLKSLGVSDSKITKDAKFDLTDILDGYLHAISEMHLYNRELTESKVLYALSSIRNIVSGFLQTEDQESCLVYWHSVSMPPEYIGLDRFDLSKHLRKKHPYAIDYSRFAFDSNGY